MKKILIGIDSLRIGGIQTALLNMLHEMDTDNYEITVKLFHYQDDYNALLPDNIKIEKSSAVLDTMNLTAAEAKTKGIIIYAFRKLLALACRVFGANFVYSVILRKEKANDEYDIAISYTNNGNGKSVYYGMNKYILERVKAKQKFAWVHVDYEALNMNTPQNNAEYNRFDKIVHVSQATQNKFLIYNPTLKDKCTVIYNFINPNRLRQLAGVVQEHEIFTIVSVGRFDANKNMSACISIGAELKKLNISFKWIMVGNGPEYDYIQSKIAESDLQESFVLVGSQKNPYTYIANADLYVSTSKTESFGLSIYEAISLGIPALAYSYPAVYEIISNGSNGYIVDPNISEMTEKIAMLATQKNFYNLLKEKCKPLIGLEMVKTQLETLIGE